MPGIGGTRTPEAAVEIKLLLLSVRICRPRKSSLLFAVGAGRRMMGSGERGASIWTADGLPRRIRNFSAMTASVGKSRSALCRTKYPMNFSRKIGRCYHTIGKISDEDDGRRGTRARHPRNSAIWFPGELAGKIRLVEPAPHPRARR